MRSSSNGPFGAARHDDGAKGLGTVLLIAIVLVALAGLAYAQDIPNAREIELIQQYTVEVETELVPPESDPVAETLSFPDPMPHFIFMNRGRGGYSIDGENTAPFPQNEWITIDLRPEQAEAKAIFIQGLLLISKSHQNHSCTIDLWMRPPGADYKHKIGQATARYHGVRSNYAGWVKVVGGQVQFMYRLTGGTGPYPTRGCNYGINSRIGAVAQ